MEPPHVLLGVDIGGTFTDLALLDTGSGRLDTHKLLTTPDDPVRAVLDGVRELLGQANGRYPDRIVHGTTLVTNALVERKGAVTGLLTTRGFRDVLEIRREGRYDLYDSDLVFPLPLVPRRRRFEAIERLDDAGSVIEPLDADDLETVLGRAAEHGVESWAVCFLHAYRDDGHEVQAGQVIRKRFPGVPVSLSSELAPEIREYERTSTTTANAYVRPVAEGYLNRLEAGLREVTVQSGDRAPELHIMQSDGGMILPEAAARFPIRIVESGPAGGVIAAARIGAGLNIPRLMSLDMGGTTAKIAFLDENGPRTRSMFEVDRQHLFKKGSGLPVQIPSLDLVEIGAGGGSIAGRGSLDTLVVGPESAGADPGPACYGGGGMRATVTDADLLLGLLNPGYFLGGTMELNIEAATDAIDRDVAQPLKLSLMESAKGIHTLVGSNMSEAARVHAAERGLDLATHTLVAFGGAGPVHAWGVARQLRIPRILFPGHAGVESALGFLAAAPAFEVARSVTGPLDELDPKTIGPLLEELAEEARQVVEPAGSGKLATSASVDMRYRGQGTEVRVSLDALTIDRESLQKLFETTYRKLYGRIVTDVAIETVTWRVRCERAPTGVEMFDCAGEQSPPASEAPVHASRLAWIPDLDRPAEVPVFRRDVLASGMVLSGPALIEEPECTLMVGKGTAEVLPGGTLLASLAGNST